MFFQGRIRDLVMSFREREEKQKEGQPIWPAAKRKSSTMSTENVDEEERFRAGLGALNAPGVVGAGEGKLAW